MVPADRRQLSSGDRNLTPLHRWCGFQRANLSSDFAKNFGRPSWCPRAQEQIQTINMVSGRATPNAPPTIIATAINQFASTCAPFPDMPRLHRAPAPRAAAACADSWNRVARIFVLFRADDVPCRLSARAFLGFRSRTPTPPPFSSMNSIPAASKAKRR